MFNHDSSCLNYLYGSIMEDNAKEANFNVISQLMEGIVPLLDTPNGGNYEQVSF